MKCHPSSDRRTRREARRGFTLIELLLVLTILGILAAIVLPRLVGRGKDAQIKATITQIAAFKSALNTFEVDNGDYPKSLQDLMVQPREAQNWHGPYLDTDRIPQDPWGHDYVYTRPGRHNPTSFDVTSAGPDGQLGTDDDIGNWTPSQR